MKKIILILLSVPLLSFGQSASEYVKLARSMVNKKDNNHAIEYYNKAIELEPYNSEIYSERGSIKFFNLKDKLGACDDWKKAASLGNDSAKKYRLNFCEIDENNSNSNSSSSGKDYTYWESGLRKGKFKLYILAIKDLTKFISLYPDDGDGWSQRGVYKMWQEDVDGACADWKRGVELGSEKVLSNGISMKIKDLLQICDF